MNATNKNTPDNKKSSFLTKTAVTIGALGIMGFSGDNANADDKLNHNIDNTKSSVSEVLEHDPMKQLPVDLSKEIVKGMVINDTRNLLAKLETNKENKENGKYGSFLKELKKNEPDIVVEYTKEFNKLDEKQKRFAVKLYEAGKNDPVLLQEKSNKWLAVNCIELMKLVTTLKQVIKTGNLEEGKTTDLSDNIELVLELCPQTQSVLTPKVVAGLKDIETNAYLKIDEKVVRSENTLQMLQALLFSSI